MTLEERINASITYKHSGYNCAQAVILAYSDLLNIDRNILTNIGSGFGSGMGCMEGTCGALCGAVIVAGILKNSDNTKLISKQLLTNFENKCGATICKDLKGINTGKPLCSCDDCVKNVVIALTEELNFQIQNI